MLKRTFFPIILLTLAQCSTQPKVPRGNSSSTDTLVPTSKDFTQTPLVVDTAQKKTYDQLCTLLEEGNFSAADELIKGENFDINDYEQRKHDDESWGRSNFCGLLWTFSTDSPDSLVVQFLLNHGVDPNLTGCTWLDELSHDFIHEYPTSQRQDNADHLICNTGIAELLIKAGSNYALNALMECAVNDKSIPKILELLARGAKPDVAIHVAFEVRDSQLFKKLMNAGGNIDEALFWATEYEDLSIVKEMLDKGARIRKTGNWISNAAYSKNEELKNLVVGRIDGVMYSDLGPEGAEPSSIMRAAEGGDYSAVEFMLKAGTDPNWWLPDTGWPYDRSALECAESNGHTDVAELLKKYGAKKPEK